MSYAITCLKIGDKFTSDYVNRLYSMVRKQTDAPFYCFTDDPEGIEDGPLVEKIDVEEHLSWENWWAAWYKLCIFNSPVLEQYDRKIFFDLDVIIHGNIQPILDHDDDFSLIYSKWKGVRHRIDYPHKSMYNSSCMVWKDNKHIYDYWMQSPKEFVEKYHGTDDFYHNEKIKRTALPPISYSYRDGVKPDQKNSLVMREDHALAILHQKPKNHELDFKQHPIVEYWK